MEAEASARAAIEGLRGSCAYGTAGARMYVQQGPGGGAGRLGHKHSLGSAGGFPAAVLPHACTHERQVWHRSVAWANPRLGWGIPRHLGTGAPTPRHTRPWPLRRNSHAAPGGWLSEPPLVALIAGSVTRKGVRLDPEYSARYPTEERALLCWRPAGLLTVDWSAADRIHEQFACTGTTDSEGSCAGIVAEPLDMAIGRHRTTICCGMAAGLPLQP